MARIGVAHRAGPRQGCSCHASWQRAVARCRTVTEVHSAADFEPWYRSERPRVVGAVYAACRDRTLADDITDEAFARAVCRWNEVASMQSPGAWVHKVAVNALRRSMRRQAYELRLISRQRPPAQTSEDSTDIWDAVRRLPLRQRTAVVLRFVADFQEADIATHMGVARGTVSSTLADARVRLASILADDGGAERAPR